MYQAVTPEWWTSNTPVSEYFVPKTNLKRPSEWNSKLLF